MSSIQTFNQIPFLNTNNITLQKKSNIKIKNLDSVESTENLFSSVKIHEPIDFIEKENSTAYTISSSINSLPENIEYLDNNIDNYTNIFNDDDTKNILNQSNIYSFQEPLQIINNSNQADDLPKITFDNNSNNIQNYDLSNAVLELNNDDFDALSDPSQQTYVLNSADNDFIKEHFMKQDNNKINDNSIISSGSIITNSISPNNQSVVSSNILKDNSFVLDKKDTDHPAWTPLTFAHFSNEIKNSIKEYQEHFNELKNTKRLDKKFIDSSLDASFSVNGNKISKTSVLDILHEFKKIIPNLESRQLLSSYAHTDIFKKPIDDLFFQNPDLYNFKENNPVVKYDIQELNNGQFKLYATHIAELKLKNYDEYYQENKSIGIKASFLLSKDKIPEIYYASFIK